MGLTRFHERGWTHYSEEESMKAETRKLEEVVKSRYWRRGDAEVVVKRVARECVSSARFP